MTTVWNSMQRQSVDSPGAKKDCFAIRASHYDSNAVAPCKISRDGKLRRRPFDAGGRRQNEIIFLAGIDAELGLRWGKC